MFKILLFLCMSSCGIMHAYDGYAYADIYNVVINTPDYGKCRELTDEEIEQVAQDEQPGHGYWQTWDVNIPKDDQ